MKDVKIDCRKESGYCGICCHNTEMPLTEEDIKRISSLGYKAEDFTVRKDVMKLRNIDGRCYFLENNRCSIYEFRPAGCRIYPFVLDDKGELTLDDLCPRVNFEDFDSKSLKQIKNELKKLVREIYGD
jgi:hypothetical protein